MMVELKRLLEDRDIEFNAQDRRIMCFPHVINICVKHILDQFSNIDPALANNFASAFPNDDTMNSDLYFDALQKQPIVLGRQIVKAIRASGLRREEFTHVIKSCNSSGLFRSQGQVIQVPEYQLLRDVKTRWDSEYFMINRLRAMRPVSFFHNQVHSL
jgi:hypothetical protein